jgi:hypothetical protein
MVKRMASSVLVFETLVVLFFALVAMKLSSLGAGTVWAICGPAMLLCVLLCGMLKRSWAYHVGWALQIALIAAGFVVPDMFFVGGFFALLWYWALQSGRRIDTEKAAAYAAYEAAQAAGEDTPEAALPQPAEA